MIFLVDCSLNWILLKINFFKMIYFILKYFFYFTLFNSQETDIVSPEGHPMLNNVVYLK